MQIENVLEVGIDELLGMIAREAETDPVTASLLAKMMLNVVGDLDEEDRARLAAFVL